MTVGPVGGVHQAAEKTAWEPARWAPILDRIEYRQVDIGLRWWAPPLWLEVTMRGPDSESWAFADAGALPERPWDWQADEPCERVASMALSGAGDDELLAEISTYALTNLVLNAVHEVGEWLRFDAARVFPAHRPPGLLADGTEGTLDGGQGNGAVRVMLDFGRAACPAAGASAQVGPLPGARMERIGAVAASWRFTYRPGVTVTYCADGPVVTDRQLLTSQQSWSPATAAAAGDSTVGDEALAALVRADVHAALVRHEAARVADAYVVDGRRPWRIAGAPERTDDEAGPPRAPVGLTISYDAGPASTRR